MADDFGRVNLYPRILDRGAREEPYQGRHGRKHSSERADEPGGTPSTEEEPEASAAGSHIDLRI